MFLQPIVRVHAQAPSGWRDGCDRVRAVPGEGVSKGVSMMIGHGIYLRSGEKQEHQGVRESEKLVRSVGLKGSRREDRGASGCARRWWPEVLGTEVMLGCRCGNDKGRV